MNKLSKDKTIRIFHNQNKNLYPESKLVCHRHTMILTDNACFKAKHSLVKSHHLRNMKPYYRLNGLKRVKQRRLFTSYVIMLNELVTHGEHHRIVLFELIS